MITIRNEGIILEKTNLPFENQAVLNPACIEIDGIVHMFYRAVQEGNFSTIGYCQLKDNKVIYRADKPILIPEHDYESKGLEDPRIIKHEDGNYYLFYTAYDGKTAQAACAVTTDLKNFKKLGLMNPALSYESILEFTAHLPLKQKYLLHALEARHGNGENALLWDKDAFIFPKKIKGKYVMVHRIFPSIQIMYFDTFEQLRLKEYWIEYFKDIAEYTILDPREGDSYVGGGCPPIETPDGWLLIYHRVIGKKEKKMYCAGLALLDIDNPKKVIAKLKDPFFYPQETWETNGTVNNVVFPTGTILSHDGRLYIYYGAADSVIGAKSVTIPDLLKALKDPNYSHIAP
jgi:predicted GH43/DUF377 family glycosyl hydrolase